MSVKQSKLQTCVRAFIHSFEGGIYLLEIEESGISEWVHEPSSASPRRFQTLLDARRYARKRGVEDVQLSQDTAYEEMIGLASLT